MKSQLAPICYYVAMSKKAIIFHGTDCKPEDFWYQWLGSQLETKGYTVEIPHYPEINREPIETFLPKILKNHTFDEETIIIGHSAGGPLLLSILQNIDVVLPQAILVAGYARIRPEDNGQKDVVLQDDYDWAKIKEHAKDFVFVNSTNDPWGCNDIEGRHMFDQLGGTLVIRNDGHFGSTANNQPYKEFPLLESLITF